MGEWVGGREGGRERSDLKVLVKICSVSVCAFYI